MNDEHLIGVLNIVLKDFASEFFLQPLWYHEMSTHPRESDQEESEKALRTVPRKLRPYENPKLMTYL